MGRFLCPCASKNADDSRRSEGFGDCRPNSAAGTGCYGDLTGYINPFLARKDFVVFK